MNLKKNLPLTLVVTGLAIAGINCSKQASPAPNASASADSASAATPAAALPVANPVTISAPAPADNPQVLEALTQALRRYAFERRGLPQSFESLVAAGYVKNPPAPPAGKKFAVDAKTSRVVLINQ